MAQEPKYKLIEEEALRDLIATNYRHSYAIILLSYVCSRQNINIGMTALEACGVLNLSPRQLEEARKRCQIRTLGAAKNRVYSAYDLAMLAAQLHRKNDDRLQKDSVIQSPANSGAIKPLLSFFSCRDRSLVKAAYPVFVQRSISAFMQYGIFHFFRYLSRTLTTMD